MEGMVVLAVVMGLHWRTGQIQGHPEGEEEQPVCLSLTVRSKNARFFHIQPPALGHP